jgi:8-oxo-dGTP diphosphatase
MPYTPILATLGYVFSPDGQQVLLIHRNKNLTDHHLGKYNGLGGKLEPGEHILEGIRREIREEAGIECDRIELCGTISWPGFGKQGEDWFGFIFRIASFTGTPSTSNTEGDLVWVNVEEVMNLPLWPGDRHFLPLVFQYDGKPFHGVMPYQDGQPLSWSYGTEEK